MSFAVDEHIWNDTVMDSTYRVHIMPSGYIAMAVYLTLVGVIATVGNATVLFVLLKLGTFRKRAINFLLINLAFSDLCVSFTGYPLTTISSYSGHWVFGYRACQFNGFAVFALSSSSMGTHAALAVYRYVYVCKHNVRPKLTAAVTRRVIIALWFHAFFWAVTPLIGWSKYDYEPFGTSCSIDWISRTVNNYSFMLLTTITNYVIPVIIMVICYTKIIRRSRKVDPLRVEERDRSMRVINKLDQLEIKIDTHVTKMCIVMTCSFIIAWTPYAVESLWMSQSSEFVGPISSTLPTMLAKSSCMMNPLIYLTSSSTFRMDVVKLLRRASRRPILDDNIQPPPEQGDGNGPQTSGRFYLRNTKNAHGKTSCAIYFDKKQIFIGDVSPENIERDSSLAQRDPDKISVRFSSFDGPPTGKEHQLNLPANQNLDKPEVDLPKYFEMNDNPGTSSDSKQQSRMTTSPIFN